MRRQSRRSAPSPGRRSPHPGERCASGTTGSRHPVRRSAQRARQLTLATEKPGRHVRIFGLSEAAAPAQRHHPILRRTGIAACAPRSPRRTKPGQPPVLSGERPSNAWVSGLQRAAVRLLESVHRHKRVKSTHPLAVKSVIRDPEGPNDRRETHSRLINRNSGTSAMAKLCTNQVPISHYSTRRIGAEKTAAGKNSSIRLSDSPLFLQGSLPA